MQLRTGQSVASALDSTVLVVVRAPEGEVTLLCGGEEMLEGKQGVADAPPVPEQLAGGVQLGKRYVDEATGLELLCVKPGSGRVEVDGREVVAKTAKPLPASD